MTDIQHIGQVESTNKLDTQKKIYNIDLESIVNGECSDRRIRGSLQAGGGGGVHSMNSAARAMSVVDRYG